MTKKSKLKADLIASIAAPRRKFDMTVFMVEDGKAGDGTAARAATCGTARCMAGHLEAIRPKLAKKLLPAYTEWFTVDHAELARAIWEYETGEKCLLDFMGNEFPGDLGDITVEQAVAHIKGRSKKWPQLLP